MEEGKSESGRGYLSLPLPLSPLLLSLSLSLSPSLYISLFPFSCLLFLSLSFSLSLSLIFSLSFFWKVKIRQFYSMFQLENVDLYGLKYFKKQDNSPQGRKTCVTSFWCEGTYREI